MRSIISGSAALLLCGISVASAQRGGLRDGISELFAYGDDYFLEVAVFPTGDPVRSRCDVLFRFTYDLLEFKREASHGETGGGFEATPSLFVEATNAEGIIVGRGMWKDTVRVDSFSATNLRDRFVSGVITLALKPGTHAIRYSFDNGRPGSGFTRTTESFTVDDPISSAPTIGSPLFLRSNDLDTLRLLAIDGNAQFGRPLRVYVPLGGTTPASSLRYQLLLVRPRPASPVELQSGSARSIVDGRVGRSTSRGGTIDLPIITDDSTGPRLRGGYIEMTSDELSPGDYALVLTAGSSGGVAVDTARFSLRWIDAPFSLSRPDYAIRALYPIATDDEIDRLLSGDRKRQQEALDLFWSERDPTPTTRYNEAMAEYYRRVDYAYINFRTVERRDGVGSDRGKIYILNGPPTQVSREMDPSGPPREIWVYRNRVARVFVFSDTDRNGDFRLVSYHDLAETGDD